MEPTVELTTPYDDPAGTFRATSVGQMYSFVPLPAEVNITYELGIPPTFRQTFALRNHTMSHVLKVNITIPSFMSISPNPNMFLAPLGNIQIVLTMNEPNVRTKAISGTKNFTEGISISIVPMDVNGPVYVRRNLDD